MAKIYENFDGEHEFVIKTDEQIDEVREWAGERLGPEGDRWSLLINPLKDFPRYYAQAEGGLLVVRDDDAAFEARLRFG